MRTNKNLSRLICVILFSSFLAASPAKAADNWPSAPTPDWAASTPLTGLRIGQWLPCNADWKSTNDCIQSLSWTKLDGSRTGNSTFIPNPAFDPMTAKQIWDKATTPQGGTIDNYAHFDNTFAGKWKLPDGFTNTDGSDQVYVEAHVMSGSLQFRVVPNSDGSLPSNSYATITLKSSSFAKYAGWILSNSRDPKVTIVGDIVTISGTPVMTPYDNKADAATCSSNKVKATGSQSVIQISIFMGDAQPIKAGDAILGTNGNGCFTGVSFDPNTRSLVVGVGNVHFDVDGTPVQGWFDLRIKGSRAKQWWGIEPTLAVKSVQVQVIYEDGTSVIATTQADYDPVNVWITLKSQGFHYSSPRLRVSLGKTIMNSTPTTITCVKGKTTKKVTAVKPTCPIGFKKK